MKSENTNINEVYFLGSFGRNPITPEHFKLKKVDGAEHYIDQKGNSWQSEILWDNGWGNINGFVKFPEPNFKQLWTLLTESNIKINQLGAAELPTQYPKKVKKKLEKIFGQDKRIDQDLTKRLSHLDVLNHVMNRSKIKGKRLEEVEADYQEWKKLKDDFDRLKTITNYNSFWQRIKTKFIRNKKHS